MYKMRATEVKERINKSTIFEMIDFEWRVDATAYFYVRCNGELFEKILSSDDMKLDAENLYQLVNRLCNKFFYNW